MVQDADSLDLGLDEKREGAFYVWTEEEIDEVLGNNATCRLFKSFYYVKKNGNVYLSKRR